MSEEIHQIEEDACFIYIPNAITEEKEELEELYQLLIQKEKIKFVLYGKECTMQRKQALFGPKNYTFSNQTFVPEEKMNSLVQKCINYANQKYPFQFNTALCNLYQNGKDYISPHRDNEAEHQVGIPILTFSFGTERKFLITNKRHERKYHQTFPLQHQSCGIMLGNLFQKKYKHSITRDKSEEWRISITVRKF